MEQKQDVGAWGILIWNKYKLFFCGAFFILVIFLSIIHVLFWKDPSAPIFNYESGFYNDGIDIELSSRGLSQWKAVIKYNTNGDSLDGTSETYSEKIRLDAPEKGYKLYTITAKACIDDRCSEPKNATYVLGKNLKNDIDLKIFSINSSRESLYDYNFGIMIEGATYDVNKSIVGDGDYIKGNYNNRGDGWARSASVNIFDVNGELLYDGDSLIEVSGWTSSSFDVKSLKMTLLNKDEGFSEEFRLRSGGQDQFDANIRSSVANRLINESGFDGGAETERVVVFLNGEFYGIFDKQINYSKQNLAIKYNISKQKFIRKYKGSEETVFNTFEIDKNIWDNLENEENREKLERTFDMDNYLQYYAIQILMNNTDWPGNNFEAWRYDGPLNLNNQYEDNRIRFLIYDTDLIYYAEGNTIYFDGSISDSLENLMEQKYNGRSSMFFKVMESEHYNKKFNSIINELLDGPFATENVLNIINDEARRIEHQYELFYTPEKFEAWKENVELLKSTASRREDEVRKDMKKYFGTD